MRLARRIGWSALLAGVLALLIVPMVVPISSTGTRTVSEVAPPGATFIDIGSLTVHYQFLPHRGGLDNPPLFVLLHGFGASTYSWREVVEPLADLGDVVAYDRPAFGLTQRPTEWSGPSPYGSDAQLELVANIIDTFGDEGQPVVVVGHSAGGTLAAEFALRSPEKVSGLILVAPAILTTGGGPGWLSWFLQVPQIDRLGPILVGGIATSGDELLERSWHDLSKLTPEIRDNYRIPLQIENWERAFWEFQKAPRDFRISSRPEDLLVPVAIITGDDDRVVPTSDSLELGTLIQGSAVAVIPRSGHLPQEETPEEFLSQVLAFLPGLIS